MKYFHCTKYKVDQARKLKSLANGLDIPKKATVTRNKLNIQKCEHFLDCLFNNKFWQDVAYSVTNLKIDTRDCQEIAHVGGFDNLTASGINRFEALLKLASKHRIEKTTTKTIQNEKRYLKTTYPVHCNTISYSQSKTHSLIFFI